MAKPACDFGNFWCSAARGGSCQPKIGNCRLGAQLKDHWPKELQCRGRGPFLRLLRGAIWAHRYDYRCRYHKLKIGRAPAIARYYYQYHTGTVLLLMVLHAGSYKLSLLCLEGLPSLVLGPLDGRVVVVAAGAGVRTRRKGVVWGARSPRNKNKYEQSDPEMTCGINEDTCKCPRVRNEPFHCPRWHMVAMGQ